MAIVQVRDSVIWVKHISDDNALQDTLLALNGGDCVSLEINGMQGVWEKMKDGKDGRPTPGIKPLGPMKSAWEELERGTIATIEVIEPASQQEPNAAQQFVKGLVMECGTCGFEYKWPNTDASKAKCPHCPPPAKSASNVIRLRK